MKADSVKQNENQQFQKFNNVMNGIEFMQKHMYDPDIFTADSTSFRSFLIQSFCHLHSDFHYLSFLKKGDVDLEIIKVASILQILPSNTIKKTSKLFDNMSKDDIHKFWLKFFTLFKDQNNFKTDSIFSISWENKINFFRDMNSTLNYLNYECPIISSNRLSSVSISKEVDIWKEQTSAVIVSDESTCLNYNEEITVNIDVKNLIVNLEQVVSLYNNTEPVNKESKPEYVDFFIKFINHIESILQYKTNLRIISSRFLEELNYKLLSNDDTFLENLYFIKRCNNFIKTLKSKIKILH